MYTAKYHNAEYIKHTKYRNNQQCFLFVVFQGAQRECNISMSHVAGGTVGGVGMGIIVTLVATVMFF